MNTEKENINSENNEDMESHLWAYLDGDSEEESTIEELLSGNRDWQEKYGELLELHTLMKGAELEQPSLRFTKNVLEEITRQQVTTAARSYINSKIIWGIAAFFITVILGFLVYGLSQVDWASSSQTGKPIGVDFGAVDYSRMFNNTFINGFMMLNVVLALFFLDRYLSFKRKKMEGNLEK